MPRNSLEVRCIGNTPFVFVHLNSVTRAYGKSLPLARQNNGILFPRNLLKSSRYTKIFLQICAKLSKLSKHALFCPFIVLEDYLLRALKYRLRGFVIPAVFLSLTYYFGWNAVHGQNGLKAQVEERAQLQVQQQQTDEISQRLTLWKTKVAALSSHSIEPDMLNAEARTVLNLADPNDLVVDLPTPASGK